MKGVIFNGSQAEVTTALDVREPGPTEVKIKIMAAGVCHSDLSVINGTIAWPSPVVLGHEGAGVVESVGIAVRSVGPGDHVVVATLASCGHCRWCSSGHPTWCRQSMGNVAQPFTLGGEPCSNFAAASVFAEYTVVSEIQAVKIDRTVPFTSACLIGCGVVTGVGAVLNRARLAQGETAAVFGVGGIGLNVIQAARMSGASRIIAVDTVASKEKLARQFGATDFIDAATTDPVAAIREMLPFRDDLVTGPFSASGVNWSFDCVGHPSVLRSAVDVLDWGGNCVIIGVPAPTAELTIPITFFTHVDRGLMGCRYGSIRPHYDIPLIVDRYKAGQLKLDELVSKTYPVEEFDAVVADVEAGHLARGVLTF
ncbi:MAG: Zn-dependent alcohol dehydrogenase [Acidimicrobiales bacterium]